MKKKSIMICYPQVFIHRLLCLFLICHLSNAAIAQLGIRGGVNFSNLNIEEGVDLDARSGVQAGLVYTLGLSERIMIRPGLVFSMKGYENLGETGDLTYLEMPLSILLELAGGFYLEVGPYAGLMLDSENVFEENYQNLDLGLNLGAGLRIGRLDLGITYGYGLANIVEGGLSTGGVSARNKNVGLFGIITF